MKQSIDKLTEKEEEIMLLLWEHGPCSVKDLTSYFPDPKPHVNTVSTFVRLLEKKGYAGHEPGRSGGYNYFALKKKSEYRRNTVGRLIKNYFGSCFSMVSQLVEEEQIDAEQLRQLIEIVEKKKGEK